MASTNGTQKSVLITGASTGIGRDAVLHLAKLGFTVFAGVRKESDAEALRQNGSTRVQPVIIDVMDSESINAAVANIRNIVGENGLDGLVNNAGIAVAGPLEFVPLGAAREQFEVNVIGQIAVTQACLPLLRKAKGRIVNIGSIAGLVPKPFAGLYGASKAAMEALTDALRMELDPWGISVSIIEPGSIATPIWEKSGAAALRLADKMPPQFHEYYGAAIERVKSMAQNIGRNGDPVELVSKTIEHALTSDRPRTRYLVGKEAKLQARLARFLTDRMLDRMILKRIAALGKKK